MKKYIRCATKTIQHGNPYRRPGPNSESPWKEYVDYTDIKELYQMLKDAGFGNHTKPIPNSKTLYTAEIKTVSGPATVTVYTKPNDTSTYVRVEKDGKTVVDNWFPRIFRPVYDRSYDHVSYSTLKSALSATDKQFDKMIDPKYQREQQQKRFVKKVRQMSTDQLIDEFFYRTRIPDKILKSVLWNFMHQVNDKDISNIYDWTFDKDESTESWANIHVQGYGYTTTYVITLDTGYNTYTAETSKTEGWHTE